MRRPLLAVCICIVIGLSVWQACGGTDSVRAGGAWYRPATETSSRERGVADSPQDGDTVTVTGEVYRKDFNYFYLHSMSMEVVSAEINSAEEPFNAASQQQNFSLIENCISKKTLSEKRGSVLPKGKLQCQTEGDMPRIGSIVTLCGTFEAFSEAANPGEYDAAGYYRTQDLAGRITEITDITSGEEYAFLQEGLFRLRKYFRDRLYRIFPEKEASVMAAMLLGDKSELDSRTKQLYQENGIIHILSISGLHITLIGMSIYKLFRRMGLPVWNSAIIGAVMLLLYGVMTGMSISACRAIGMFLIRMLAEVVGRTYDMLTALGVMAVVLVVSEPLNLQNAGFLLSFGAILGIGVLYPALSHQEEEEGAERYEERQLMRVLKEMFRQSTESLRQSFLSGISVTLLTLPILLWFYYEVPVYSVVINLLILPFMTVVMLTGLAAMLIPGGGMIGTVDCIILAGYEAACRFFGELPFSVWNPGRPKLWQIVVYYSVIGVVVLLAKRCRKSKWRRGRILVLLLTAGIFAIDIPDGDKVTFLDVGQGDCICVELSTGEVYLFDCGSTSRGKVGEYVLKPFLKYSGISHVDGVFVSHPDQDHYSGIAELMEKGEEWHISVGQLVLSGGEDEGAGGEAEEWPEGFEDYITVQAGDYFQAGEVIFRCLHPPTQADIPDSNARSQCFYAEFGGGVSLLLTGDVEGEGESLLLEQLKKQGISDITLLKVAHHGSRNATGTVLLERLKPQVSVISCGRDNSYGHPHEETLERLESVGSKVLTTPEYGAITVEIKEKEMRIYGFTK